MALWNFSIMLWLSGNNSECINNKILIQNIDSYIVKNILLENNFGQSYKLSLKQCLHWQSFIVIMPATATHDSHCCTCLGHLGWCTTDRIISILLTCVAVADGFTNNLCQCPKYIRLAKISIETSELKWHWDCWQHNVYVYNHGWIQLKVISWHCAILVSWLSGNNSEYINNKILIQKHRHLHCEAYCTWEQFWTMLPILFKAVFTLAKF